MYKLSMNKRERIEQAIERAGFKTQEEIAAACGVKQPSVHALLNGVRPMKSLLAKIAEKTGVSHDWLRFGDPDKAPVWMQYDSRSQLPRVSESVVALSHQLPVVGTVIAGDGKLSDRSAFESDGEPPIMIPDSWHAVVVKGMSAYPVIYPDQIALIDTNRAARPDSSDWSEKQMKDLHDNIVLVQTNEPPEIGKATSGHRAYLKRFCKDDRAPDGFVLASLDGGRSSPYVPADLILMIVPVVAVLYQDPRRPREKRWHAKTVVATIHP